MATARERIAVRNEFDYESVNGDREQARGDMIETLQRVVSEGVESARSEG